MKIIKKLIKIISPLLGIYVPYLLLFISLLITIVILNNSVARKLRIVDAISSGGTEADSGGIGNANFLHVRRSADMKENVNNFHKAENIYLRLSSDRASTIVDASPRGGTPRGANIYDGTPFRGRSFAFTSSTASPKGGTSFGASGRAGTPFGGKMSPSDSYSLKALIHLGNLYYEGLPDKYDFNGTRIKGISPNIEKAKICYAKAYRLGEESGLLHLANLYFYEYALHMNFNDREKAINIYNRILTNVNSSNESRAEATFKLTELNTQLDGDPRGVIYFGANSRIATPRGANIYDGTSFTASSRGGTNSVASPKRGTPGGANSGTGINSVASPKRGTIVDVSPSGGTPFRASNRVGTGLPLITLLLNDLQNSHDNGVTNSVKKAIKILRGLTPIMKSNIESLNEIRESVKKYAKNDKFTDANRVLDRIESNKDVFGDTGIKETEALNLVWNRINHPKLFSDEQRESLKNNLVNELSESVEHGNVVCTTGRFNRIIDSLNGIDPNVTIKPKYVISNEMLRKSAIIRDSFINKLPISKKNAFESLKPTDEQQIISKKIEEDLKNTIRSELQTEYVGGGSLSQSIFDSEINKWINDVV